MLDSTVVAVLPGIYFLPFFFFNICRRKFNAQTIYGITFNDKKNSYVKKKANKFYFPLVQQYDSLKVNIIPYFTGRIKRWRNGFSTITLLQLSETLTRLFRLGQWGDRVKVTVNVSFVFFSTYFFIFITIQITAHQQQQ